MVNLIGCAAASMERKPSCGAGGFARLGVGSLSASTRGVVVADGGGWLCMIWVSGSWNDLEYTFVATRLRLRSEGQQYPDTSDPDRQRDDDDDDDSVNSDDHHHHHPKTL